jgi:hypothetical protein
MDLVSGRLEIPDSTPNSGRLSILVRCAGVLILLVFSLLHVFSSFIFYVPFN